MKYLYILIACVMVSLQACKSSTMNANASANANSQTNEWEILFNGDNLDHWKTFGEEGIPPEYTIEDSVLVYTPSNRRGQKNIVTKKIYHNFVLSLDWKISEGGNGGIFWAVQDSADFRVPYVTGPEIQIIDNERHPDAKNGPDRQAGALYDMKGPSKNVANPAEEWNHVEIMINYDSNEGSIVQNGETIVEFAVKGEEWDEMIKNSKFNGWDDFAKSETGKIGLQDHGNKVWYKNIKIKEL